MMSKFGAFLSCTLGLLILVAYPGSGRAQEPGTPKKGQEGHFELTLKTPSATKLSVSDLVRDRNLNPGFLYRVRTGGYLGFSEADWVDKLEFKVTNIPITTLDQYKKYSDILFAINEKLDRMTTILSSYDELSLRLMNICDRSRFPTLQSIDDNVHKQLTIYNKLQLLRQSVVNSMNKFVRERACRDKFADYQKSLNLYSQKLEELTTNFDRLNKRAVMLSRELAKGTGGRQSPKTK
jgi:hypothetical protein